LLLAREREQFRPPDGGYLGANTAEGTDALLSLSSGTNNTAMGADPLANNVSGNDNTAVGFQALLGVSITVNASSVTGIPNQF